MKTRWRTNRSATASLVTAAPPIKICMHVRGVVRTDGRVLREATALMAEGYAVTIVDVEDQRGRASEEDIGGLRVRHIVKPHWYTPTHRVRRVVRSLEKFFVSTLAMLRESADIYHAHDVNALPATYITARLHRRPLVFDAHELPLNELDRSRLTFLSAVLRRFLKYMLARCAGVITVSAPIAQEIRERFSVQEVTLVRNIPAYQAFTSSDCLRASLGLDSDIRIALYQGNIQADRGLDVLIHTAAFLDQKIVIVLMGKDVAGTRSRLEALALREQVAERVKIIPPVPYAELLDWTASATLGLIVYPPNYSLNVQMCLPNKLFEYLMVGLPVLASPLVAVADLLATYKVGRVVESLEPAAIAVAINAVLADPAELAKLRENALKAVRKDLCWEQERQQLITLYQGIAPQESARQLVSESLPGAGTPDLLTGERDAHSLHL